MSNPPSFRDELQRLEAIVRSLEDPDLDLDAALELFQEGVTRLKTARDVLKETELTVKKVVESADESLRTKDLDA